MSETLPLSVVKARLSQIVDHVEAEQTRVVLTRNGRPAAVLISPSDLEALEETVDLLSDPEAMRRIAEGLAALAAGDVVDEAELRQLRDRLRQRRGA
jgi:antitoxin YefM